MSAEQSVRDILVASGPLVAVVPATRISLDAVAQSLPRPYIVLSKQPVQTTFGLDNTVLARTSPIDIQCIGISRVNAVAVRELVEAALLGAGLPWSGSTAGYDAENDLEAEVVSVDWIE